MVESLARHASEHRVHTTRQDSRAEGLDDVVVSSGVQAVLGIGFLCAGSEWDHRCSRQCIVAAKRDANLGFREAWHHLVEYWEVSRFGSSCCARAFTIMLDYDMVSGCCEFERDQLADVTVVVGKEDAAHLTSSSAEFGTVICVLMTLTVRKAWSSCMVVRSIRSFQPYWPGAAGAAE